jgi:hypothetical protein
MPTNPYRQKLLDEVQGLIRRKIHLRDLIARYPFSFRGDDLDRKRAWEDAQRQLVWAENEHARLRHELGLPEPLPEAIPLVATAPTRRAPQPVRRSVGAYVTRDMAAHVKTGR